MSSTFHNNLKFQIKKIRFNYILYKNKDIVINFKCIDTVKYQHTK